jgi:hypothetical protein
MLKGALGKDFDAIRFWVPHRSRFSNGGNRESQSEIGRVLQMTAPRNLTQLVSRVVFSEGSSGIYYRSKYGHDVENWALFEPFQINAQDPEPIRLDDPDLQRALRLHSLKFKK